MTRPYRLLSSDDTNSPPQVVAESPDVNSDSVLLIAALVCGLVCVVCLIVVAYWTWLRRRRSMADAQPSPANRGIKKEFIEALPKFAYDEESVGKVSSGECVICLAEYVIGDEIRVLPQCGHGFHVGCIDKWLESHSSCPSCRQILVIGDEECATSFRRSVLEKVGWWWKKMKVATVNDA
ncbi:hypothetical protein R6Q57_014187 [Mikania cordata]